jgi:catechol 2,3-dioxygenase-like lactoylglutathione lyase family enzyme
MDHLVYAQNTPNDTMRHLSETQTAIELKRCVMSDGPFTRLDHVQLAMPGGEEDRAREFYVGVLGLQEVTKPPELAKRGGCWFSSGDVHVHLGVDTDFRPAKKAHPAFRCADYNGLTKRLSDLGVRVVPDEISLDGKAHCYFADPFGNRIELVAE